jgi:hypothetical protein
VAEYARKVGKINLYYYDDRGQTNGVVNAFLCNSSPVVLETKSSPYKGHFVVATGQANENTWNINDPGYYNLTTLSTNSYVSYRNTARIQKNPSAIWIAVHSPLELLITDPAGRRTGLDPLTNSYVNEILDSSYYKKIDSGDGSAIDALIFSTGATAIR